MARIRTIKPEFWNDEDVGELSMAARLAFIASWSLCDDEGLLPWTPAYIRAQVFAYDDISLEGVEIILGELQEKSLVVPYRDGKGKKYGWIVNFRKHQRIDKPQKPKHPVPSLQNGEIREAYANRDGWCCGICGSEIDRLADTRSEVLSLDHIKPRSAGGSDAPSNIRATHCGCNSSKKDTDNSENVPGKIKDRSDTEGIKDQGKEQGKERNMSGKPDPVAVDILDFLNEKTGKSYKAAKTNLEHINARLRDGYSLEQFKHAISVKVAEWKGTDMEMYLRPTTLFNSKKFDGYVNQPKPARKKELPGDTQPTYRPGTESHHSTEPF